jgi:hypothetical protein
MTLLQIFAIEPLHDDWDAVRNNISSKTVAVINPADDTGRSRFESERVAKRFESAGTMGGRHSGVAVRHRKSSDDSNERKTADEHWEDDWTEQEVERPSPSIDIEDWMEQAEEEVAEEEEEEEEEYDENVEDEMAAMENDQEASNEDDDDDYESNERLSSKMAIDSDENERRLQRGDLQRHAAVEILRQVRLKLDGRWMDNEMLEQSMSVEQQYQTLIREATDVDRLCALFEGSGSFTFFLLI